MSVELLPTRPGQPLTMTVATDDPDCGHWYSPAFVRAAVNAALERAAQVCSHLDDWTGGHGMPASPGSSVYVAAIRALKSEGA